MRWSGRLLGRRLDRSRPLWEIYLVEGLADGRFAVVTKTHHAMVDGLASMDVGTLLLDPTPEVRDDPARRLVPGPGAVVAGSGRRRRARGDAAARARCSTSPRGPARTSAR